MSDVPNRHDCYRRLAHVMTEGGALVASNIDCVMDADCAISYR